MELFLDDPNPPVKESVRAMVFRRYLEECVRELDGAVLKQDELALATDTLQAILNVMQQGKLTDREALRQIDEIFVSALGQHTEKGAKIRGDHVAHEKLH